MVVSFVFTFSYLYYIINFLKYHFSILDIFTWISLALGVVGLVSLHRISLGFSRRLLSGDKTKN